MARVSGSALGRWAATVGVIGLVVCASTRAQQPQPSSISGVVIDALTHLPVGLATLTLSGTQASPRRLQADANGAFEASEVAPGIYALEAHGPYYNTGFFGTDRPDRRVYFEVKPGQSIRDATIALWSWARVSGRVTATDGQALADIPVMFFWRGLKAGVDWWYGVDNGAKTDASGRYEMFVITADKPIVVAAGIRPSGTVVKPGLRHAYEPVFYPAAGTPDAASRLAMVQGGVLRGIDLVLASRPTFDINVVPPGEPDSRLVRSVFLLQPDWCEHASCPAYESVTGVGGSLTFAGAVPGRYVLSFARRRYAEPPDSDIGSASELVWSGRQSVFVTDRDQRVEIDPAPALEIRGRVVGPDAAPPRTSVCLNAALGENQYCSQSEPDGSFSIRIPRGDYIVSAGSRTPAIMRSAQLDNVDVTDRVAVIAKSAELAVTLSSQSAKVTGLVTGVTSVPYPTWVVVFPADASMWMGERPRRFKEVVPTGGRYTFTDLPPGDYWVATVIGDIRRDGWRIPEFLRSLVARAKRAFLAEGTTTTVDLSVGEARTARIQKPPSGHR